ncbi:MAG: hypothetical protein WA708_00075 [Acidobacteriaceae bacterium]
MTLIKQHLKAETTVELSLEQTILLELQGIRKSSDELKGQVRDFRTVLMGEGDQGTPFGRVPMVEARVTVVERKVEDLEKAHIRSQAYGRVFNAIGGLIAGSIGAVTTVLANLAFHFLWHK